MALVSCVKFNWNVYEVDSLDSLLMYVRKSNTLREGYLHLVWEVDGTQTPSIYVLFI